VPLKDVRNPSSNGWLVGDVKFEMVSGSTDMKWAKVWLPNQKASMIRRLMQATDKNPYEEKEQKLHNAKLTNMVVVPPGIGKVFSTPLWWVVQVPTDALSF